MPKFQVKAPDGQLFEFNGPEGATQAQAEEYFRQNYKPSQQTSQQVSQPAGLAEAMQNPAYQEQGRLAAGMRSFLNEATLGLGRDAVAGLRAAPALFTGSKDFLPEYERQAAFEKAQLAGGEKEYGTTTALSGLAGGVGTSIAATPARVAGWINKSAPFLERAAKYALVSAPVEAFRATQNLQEGETVPQAAQRGLETAAIAGPLGATLEKGVGAVANVGRALVGGAKKGPITEAEKVIQAGKEANIPIRTTSVFPPQSWAGKKLEAASDIVPLAGTGGGLVKTQEARQKAAEDFVRQYIPEAETNPAWLQDITTQVKNKHGKMIEKFSNLKNRVLQRPEYNMGNTLEEKAKVVSDLEQAAINEGSRYNDLIKLKNQYNNELTLALAKETPGPYNVYSQSQINLTKKELSKKLDEVSSEIENSVRKKNQIRTNLDAARKENEFYLKKYGDAPKSIPTPNLMSAIDNELAEIKPSLEAERITFAEMKAKGKAPPSTGNFAKMEQELLEIKGLASNNQGLSALEKLRETFSEKFAKDPTAFDFENKLYPYLKEDMGNFLKSKNPVDFKKWQVGNQELQTLGKEVKKTSLSSIMNKGDIVPESAKNILLSKNASEVEILAKYLDDKGKQSAKSVIVEDMMARSKLKGEENIDPDKFLESLSQRQNQIKTFFSKQEQDAIEGLKRALQATKRSGKYAKSTPLQMGLGTIGAAGFGSLLPGLTQSLMGVAGAVAVGGRIYQSKAMRDTLVALGRVKANSTAEQRLLDKLISLQAGQATAREITGEE